MGLKVRPASDRAPQPPDTVRTLRFAFVASSYLHISYSVEGGLLTPQILDSGVHLLKEPSQKGAAPFHVTSWLVRSFAFLCGWFRVCKKISESLSLPISSPPTFN